MITLGDANSRSKDVFDINFLLPKCDAKILNKSLRSTFESRGDALPNDFVKRLQEIDKTVLKRGWKGAIGSLASNQDFDGTLKELLARLDKIL